MAKRAHKKWAEIEPDIRSLLKEAETGGLIRPEDSFWTPADLVNRWNDAKDLREMELHDVHEGFSEEEHFADLATDQRYYSYPEQAGRVYQVWMRYPDFEREILLEYRRDYSGERDTQSRGPFYVPTYILSGPYVVLSQPPNFDRTKGLRFVIQHASPLFTGADNDALPADWPIFSDTLLKYDTVKLCMGVEETQESDTRYKRQESGVEKFHAALEARWQAYCSHRSFNRRYATRFFQGG